jgi:hypothetical protein
MLALALGADSAPTTPVKLTQGLVITKSCTLTKGAYLLPSPESLDKPAITVRGDGITVDFGGAVLRGTPAATDPDKRVGLGVLVQGKNVTIKNARIHGYKIGLMARKSPGVRIVNADCSYNWKQRLQSTQESESGADWMSYHHNETDQWYGYGAAIYLRDCPGFEVIGSRATGGQCGLMLTDCNKGLAWNNDFSFLSGLGIGMFRCSDNRIMHNKVDWCVRGFSYGVYNRGQDSAGILVFEQCNRNVFAYNSVTHGGDGFFLWAGQTTMDTAKGGSNDNLLYGNDFSHAPTNAIEATFSRNKFINNLLVENWHGVWGGYSFETQILGNVFAYNGEGIALEHGQSNRVAFNAFFRDYTGANFWMNPEGGWGVSLGRDTSSKNGIIEKNLFKDITTMALDLRSSKGFSVTGNVFERNGKVLRGRSLAGLTFKGNTVYGPAESWPAPLPDPKAANKWITTGARAAAPPSPAMDRSGRDLLELDPAFRDDLKRFNLPWNPWPGKPMLSPLVASALPSAAAAAEKALKALAPKPLMGGMNPFLRKGTLRGRRYILVDEWGPYDFLRPILWPRETVRDAATGKSVRSFDILGPKGKWTLLKSPGGVVLSAKSGSVPGKLKVTLPASGSVDLDIELQYIGAKTTSVKGVTTPAGTPIKFGIHEFQTTIDWEARYYSFDPEKENPRTTAADFDAIVARPAVFEEKTSELSWSGRPNEKVPAEYYVTVATGTFTVPDGSYEVEFTSDDGVRAWLDGKPIVTTGWIHQGPTVYRAPVRLSGTHTLKVEHFQEDGYATLKVRLVPAAGE